MGQSLSHVEEPVGACASSSLSRPALAKQLPWCGVTSARQGGHPSLTAAGRSLAPAASGEEVAAKVTGTGLSDFFQPQGSV